MSERPPAETETFRRNVRARLGWLEDSQASLAGWLGYSEPTMSLKLRGLRTLSDKDMDGIAEFLRCSLETLTTEHENGVTVSPLRKTITPEPESRTQRPDGCTPESTQEVQL